MDQVRMPVDQTLGLLDWTGWRRPGLIFNDRGIDLEGVAGLLSADELLKIEEILVQVRSQFCHRGQDQECDQRENTDRAVYLKNQRHHLAPGLSVLMPIGKMTGFKLGILSDTDGCVIQQRCGGPCSGIIYAAR
jgi:hypothetical protein